MRLACLTFFLALGLLATGRGQPTGQLRIEVLDDATNKTTPVRVRLTQADKPLSLVPREAIAVTYGLWDHADGYAFQPDSSFYVAGTFSLDLPPGTYLLSLSKGPEYLRQTHSLTIQSRESDSADLPPEALDQHGGATVVLGGRSHSYPALVAGESPYAQLDSGRRSQCWGTFENGRFLGDLLPTVCFWKPGYLPARQFSAHLGAGRPAHARTGPRPGVGGHGSRAVYPGLLFLR